MKKKNIVGINEQEVLEGSKKKIKNFNLFSGFCTRFIRSFTFMFAVKPPPCS